jgi:hypothetical protein
MSKVAASQHAGGGAGLPGKRYSRRRPQGELSHSQQVGPPFLTCVFIASALAASTLCNSFQCVPRVHACAAHAQQLTVCRRFQFAQQQCWQSQIFLSRSLHSLQECARGESSKGVAHTKVTQTDHDGRTRARSNGRKTAGQVMQDEVNIHI